MAVMAVTAVVATVATRETKATNAVCPLLFALPADTIWGIEDACGATAAGAAMGAATGADDCGGDGKGAK